MKKYDDEDVFIILTSAFAVFTLASAIAFWLWLLFFN